MVSEQREERGEERMEGKGREGKGMEGKGLTHTEAPGPQLSPARRAELKVFS